MYRTRQRVKVTPKLTQQQIIDLLIERIAAQLATQYGYEPHYATCDIPSKNQSTLDKMLKRGLLVSEFGTYYQLSPAQIKQHEQAIRMKAATYACSEGMYRLSRAADCKRESDRWNRCKWLGTMIKRDHWCHTSDDFHFFQYDFMVDGEQYNRVRPIAGVNGIEDRIYSEEDLQQIDLITARCEIGRIPTIEIYAY